MKEIPVTLVKSNQIMLVLLTLLSILFQSLLLVVITLTLIIISLIFGPKANLAMRITKMIKKDIFNNDTESVILLRFNQMIAASLLGIASILNIITGHWISWVFVGMVTVAACVALAGFCVGCFFYYQFKKISYKLRQN